MIHFDPVYYKLWLNPEPWAIGSVTPRKGGARISPNESLVAFKAAVAEELGNVPMLPAEYRRITFFFWRQQARYLDANDKVRTRNQADSTNMQKSLEDGLQGILFENDREVRDIRSVIVEQGPAVEPCIVIKCEQFHPQDWLNDLSMDVIESVIAGPQVVKNDNVWRGPGG